MILFLIFDEWNLLLKSSKIKNNIFASNLQVVCSVAFELQIGIYAYKAEYQLLCRAVFIRVKPYKTRALFVYDALLSGIITY